MFYALNNARGNIEVCMRRISRGSMEMGQALWAAQRGVCEGHLKFDISVPESSVCGNTSFDGQRFAVNRTKVIVAYITVEDTPNHAHR
jgi:hypothetical protein